MSLSLAVVASAVVKPFRALIGRRARQRQRLASGRRRLAHVRDVLEANKLATLAEEMAGIGHYHRDLRTDTGVWSPQVYRILGLDPFTGPMTLEASLNAFHPDDRERVRAAVLGTIEHGEGFGFEARVVRPGGDIRHVVCRGAPEASDRGKITGTFGVIMDVTDAFQAQEVLRQSESRYRLLAENVTDVIVQTDPQGRLTYISPSVTAATGYTPEELTGMQFLALIEPEDQPALQDLLTATLAGQPPWRVECRVRHRDGHLLWLESGPSAVRDAKTGDVLSVTDSLRDISRRKAVEAELRQARRAAEEAAQVKADFMANMSHELRTPLTSIVGFSTLLRDQPGLSGSTARYAERIAAASPALLTLVNDILDFSKLEAGQVVLKLRPMSPRQLLDESLAMLLPQADAKDLTLEMRTVGDLPERLCIDPDRMRQVLLNLVGNAIKFTERGGVILSVGYEEASGLLRCEVRDTGPGVTPEQLNRLFVRFSQVDGSTSRAHGGAGLGLAISKALVEAMQGRIGATSTPGQGSCFWFEVPLSQTSSGEIALPAAVTDTDIVHSARVLIVDDHQSNRDLARAILTPYGCDLSEAVDGATAVQIAAEQIFDLILMDVRMPGMDGTAAARAIRQGDGPNSNIPILAFTADAADEDCDSLLAAGFDDRVIKPVTPSALVASVSRWLATQPEQSAHSSPHQSAEHHDHAA